MIEITKDKTVLWMNAQAHEQINTHPLLFIHNSKLRARERYAEASLQKAVEWAKGQLHWHISQPTSSRPAQPVILGDSSSGAPVYCWVLLEDGKIMVSFNDLQLLKRRIAVAQTIYGLTDAQVKLAEQLAQGHELVIAANNLNVSINTVRTHLQRMFDRTGVRSQSALVGCLLSAEAPTA